MCVIAMDWIGTCCNTHTRHMQNRLGDDGEDDGAADAEMADGNQSQTQAQTQTWDWAQVQAAGDQGPTQFFAEITATDQARRAAARAAKTTMADTLSAPAIKKTIVVGPENEQLIWGDLFPKQVSFWHTMASPHAQGQRIEKYVGRVGLHGNSRCTTCGEVCLPIEVYGQWDCTMHTGSRVGANDDALVWDCCGVLVYPEGRGRARAYPGLDTGCHPCDHRFDHRVTRAWPEPKDGTPIHEVSPDSAWARHSTVTVPLDTFLELGSLPPSDAVISITLAYSPVPSSPCARELMARMDAASRRAGHDWLWSEMYGLRAHESSVWIKRLAPLPKK